MKILPVILAIVTVITAYAQPYHPAKDSANFFMQRKEYDKALVNFKRSFEQGNTNLYDSYNAACAAAIIHKPDEAFALLHQAIDQGYMDKPWTESDVDFTSLHGDARWPQTMKRMIDQPALMTQKFAAIKGMDPAMLIPFRQNGRWGYLDKKTLNVVVKPEFDGLTFMNGCAEVSFYDGTKIWVTSSAELGDVVYRDHRDPDFGAVLYDEGGPFPISSANGFKGFKMDENKRITHFSDIYNRAQPALFNIHGPFVINGKYYAVAEKGDASGVIDEDGNSLKGFDFVHHELVFNSRTTDGDVWFYYEEKNGQRGFINHKGKKKLAGQLYDYPFSSMDLFNFGVQENDKSFGVVDLQKMEWVIKPQSLPIIRIKGTTTAACKKDTEDRKDMIDVYFLVSERGKEPYYIDRNMKAYKPKQ
jgi:hypothetical protein